MNYSYRFLLILISAMLVCPAAAIATTEPLPNGIYLILREAEAKEAVEPIGETEQILTKDDHYLEPAERGPTSYVVLTRKAYIPIVLGSEPQKEKDKNGRPKLMLELEKSQVQPLEEFTTKNVNHSIAIVIGGDVVTTHKIREPIKGGKMQITRCTDNGCEVLYTQLHGKASAEK